MASAFEILRRENEVVEQLKKYLIRSITVLVVFIVALTLLVFPGICYAFAGGSGTADDPYLIATPEDLYAVRDNLSAHFKLIADVDLGGQNWLPIGTDSARFEGTFDGNGHAIRNLYINRTGDHIGLFGYVEQGTVKNLGLENVYVSGGGNSTDSLGIGSLVGYNNMGTITNCYSTGSVSGGKYCTGGLVGSSCMGTITDCYSTGNVSGGYDTGGLVGGNSGTITNCYSTADVTGSDDKTGGLVGCNIYSCSTITNCYSTGSVVGGLDNTGGLVGFNRHGTITDCYSTGSVSGGNHCTGGLVGNNYRGIIAECYSTGGVSGSKRTGGLVGCNYDGNIIRCYSTGGVTGGDDNTGGLVGCNVGYITICYSTGSVSGGGENTGGLVGNNDGAIADCYWDAEASGCAVSDGGIGKTTAEMKQKITYPWDFVNVWDIEDGVSYPWLKALPRPSENDGLTLVGISVMPTSLNLQTGQQAQLAVSANYSDGSYMNVTSQASYITSDSGVVTINNGLVTAVSSGTATITISYLDKTTIVQVTVTAPVVESITVSPAEVNLPAGYSEQLTVTAHKSDGSTEDVTGLANYQVASASVASVNGGLG